MLQSNWKKKSLRTLAAGTVLAGAFYAGMAFAAPADPLLAAADLSAEKAIAQLEAAKNEGVKPPFGGHRAKAVWHIKQARKEIAKAIKYAEKERKPKPPPAPPKKKR